MKKSLIFLSIFTLIVMVGCNNEKERMAREKQLQDSFAQVLSQKDSKLDELFMELNMIDSSLSSINTKYTAVANIANVSGEITKNTKLSIADNIIKLTALLETNKEKVKNINSKLSKAGKENANLKAFIQNLELRIQEQEEQIQALNAELAKKNAKIESLNKNVEDLDSKNKMKDAQILKIEDEKNAAYFYIGTKKELLNKKLIDRKGGFIGLGRTSVLADEPDYSALTKIDIRNTQEIPLTGKKIKIITSHPETSYSLEGEEKRPTSLRITNPDLFWRATRCLIIMID
ncbi:MAG: hypothetical protein LBM25_03015 [Bacteroidales bacterium]|jgi:uncharacterized coiled-coil protein SlyX|nr:hypothetical protein [Bacteroidales bacterium]